MVLADLGKKLSTALQTLNSAITVTDELIDKSIKQIALALLQSDVDVQLVKKLQINIRNKLTADTVNSKKKQYIEHTIIMELFNLLDSGKKPFEPKKYVENNNQSNIVMFVGLQGSGKTTSCTKYANYYKRKGLKVGVVCLDTYRAGAFDQLKQNCTKCKIPYYGSYNEIDPTVIAVQGIEQFKAEKYDLIILDTSGRHKQENALFEEMKAIETVAQPNDIIFVMDSSIGQAAKLQADAFQQTVKIGSIIITKLDGNARGGGAISAVASTGCSIVFIGTGEHIDQFERFDAKSFISRLLGRGDINGLIELFQNNNIMDTQQNLVKKLMSENAEFTYRDMYEQLQNLLKMGSLTKLMGMIPGMQQMLEKSSGGEFNETDSVTKMKRVMTIMDSMTDQELDSDNNIFVKQPSRILRVARGAGVPIQAIHDMMNMFAPFKKMAENMKNMTKRMGMDPSKMQQMMSAMGQGGAGLPAMPAGAGGAGGRGGGGGMPSMRDLQNMIPPNMLQQMGGMGGIQNMMKQMMGGGGMPDMSKMMQMMQQGQPKRR